MQVNRFQHVGWKTTTLRVRARSLPDKASPPRRNRSRLDLGETVLGGGSFLASELSGGTLEDDDVHPVLDEGALRLVEAIDELDRVTNVDYPDDTLDTTYLYDTAPGSCAAPGSPLGRLASITRNGQTLDFCHDHFGRMVKDGELGYTWDANGNRTGIVYPGGVSAAYGFDFADRETSLSVTPPAGGVTPTGVVTAAAYLPSGPLSSLALGNGITETRAFDGRYVPTGITLSGLATGVPGHTWTYTTDPVGNVTEIVETPECSGGGSTVVLENQTVTTEETFTSCADLQAGNNFAVQSPGHVTFQAQGKVVLTGGFSVGNGASFAAGSGSLPTFSHRTYTYQPPQYFLTGATLDRPAGSWGTLEWSYDKIGNRLTETQDGSTPDGYYYLTNAAGGDRPVLDLVNLAVGGTRDYSWDAAGNLDSVAPGGNLVDFTVDDASRLAAADRTASGGGAASFLYDGRGFLRSATETAGGTASVTPLYDSGGLLHALRRQPSPTDPEATTYVFYLAGRPVAQLEIAGDKTETWTYLTTDHLGTPLVATDQTGAITWEGGFQPFGTDYQAGMPAGASQKGIDLRLPGQWVSDVWADATSGAGIYYNVWRFLEPQTGRFTRPDPVGFLPRLYRYAGSNPLTLLDSLGLYEIRGRFPTHPVPDLRVYCSSSIACTIPNYSFTCYCTPRGDCTWKLNGILIIGGDIYYAVGRNPYLQQTPVDPTVKGPLSAIGHEFGAHIIPSIDRVTPEIHKLERQKFPSEEACQGACLASQKRIRDLFGSTMAATQAAEGNQ